MTRAADWLPDPTGRHDHRYWDGSQWTEHVADEGAIGADVVDADLAPPDGSGIEWSPPRSWASDPSHPDLGMQGGVPSPEPEPLELVGPLGEAPEHLTSTAAVPSGWRRRRRSHRRGRRRRVVIAVAVLVLLALLVAVRLVSHDKKDKATAPPAALTRAVAAALPTLPAAKAPCVATFLRDVFGVEATADPAQAQELAQFSAPDIETAVRHGVDPCDAGALRRAIVPTTARSGAAGSPTTSAAGGAPISSTTTQPGLTDDQVEEQLTRQYAASYGLPEATAHCVATRMLPSFRAGVDPASAEGNAALDQAMSACDVSTTTTSSTTP